MKGGVTDTVRTGTTRALTWICVGLFVGTLLVFARSIPQEFVNYDDSRYVTANAFIQDPFSWQSLRLAFGGNLELWQPLTWMSHMADWALFGNRAAGHHLTSVIWHAINAALAFLLFRQFTRTTWLSAFAAAVFAWHPLRVESVSWIAERKDVMSGCFFLLTLWCYLRYAGSRHPATATPGETRSPRANAKRRLWYVATLGAFCGGLMCKPTLVTAPLLLLCFDYWPLNRVGLQSGAARRKTWRLLIEKIPFFIAAAIVGVITLHLQRAGGAFTLSLPLLARLENVPVALVRYVGKFLWPATLGVTYPHPGWWPLSVALGATGLVIAGAVAAWQSRRSQPWILVGSLWFVLLLLPTIGLVQVGFQSMADRYTYLPMLGVELALFWTVACGLRTWRVAARAAACAVVLAALTIRTWQQEAVWRDSLTLFRHAVQVSPSSATGEAFLGYTLVSLNRIDEAVPHLQRALTLDPNNETAVWSLAQAAASAGRVEESIRYFQRDLVLQPDNANTRYELALQQLRQGDVGPATENLRSAATQQLDLIAHNRELAVASAGRGDVASAAIRFWAASLMEPDNADAQLAAGIAFEAAHRDDAAVQAFRRALTLKPQLAAAHARLGLWLLNHSRAGEAASYLQQAVALDEKLVAARVGMGRIEEQRGNAAGANAERADLKPSQSR